MDRKDEEILKKLLPMFKIEAREHLDVISTGLIEIEKSEPEKQAEIIETVYREAHSLKGAAGSVSLSHVVAICQSMENVFSALKRKEIAPSSNLLDLLHEVVGCTSRLAAGQEPSHADKATIGELVRRLEGSLRKPALSDGKETRYAVKIPVSTEAPSYPALSSDDTVRISAGKLDSLLLQAEEMISLKIAAGRLTGELRELNKLLVRWKKERAGRKSFNAGSLARSGKKDDVGSLITVFESKLTNLIKSAENDQRSFGAMVDALLDDTKKALMFPLGSLLEMCPKLVRDLSRDTGKEVELITSGGGIELDRRALEQIKDPLIHLVRNCIDHGIEKPGERKQKNKPPCGIISISAHSKDNNIEISVSDDGTGIDAFKVKSAAERSGAISREEAERLDNEEALALVFRSGITTSPIITDLSGRGLGLTIVRERVEKLNGAVSLDTKPGVGTTIAMVVPVTIATFRGVLVRVGEHLFIILSANVEKVARVRKEQIQTVENRETISFDGRPVSLAKLAGVLELQETDHGTRIESPYAQVLALASAGKFIAFQVDEIIQEQEVLVKNLGPQLSRVRNIAGATLLGSGKPVPILNVYDLMISAGKIVPVPAESVSGEPSKRSSVLVVEDSITSRALLKTILESADYEVTTAVDGIEALTALKTREFDLVVSDIEMPRMNGFDLTTTIRSDKKLSEIPVVLVTALESREDKERGIDVGANAYIVKSSFEQSNHLEVIRRLI